MNKEKVLLREILYLHVDELIENYANIKENLLPEKRKRAQLMKINMNWNTNTILANLEKKYE